MAPQPPEVPGHFSACRSTRSPSGSGLPKYIFGRPADVFARTGPQLPAAVEQKMSNRLLDTIMNTAVLDHMGHGDLVARPDVASVEGDIVQFVDGTSEPYDVVVWATGYRPWFPMLPDGVIDWQGINPNLDLDVFHRDRDDLFVMA